MATWKVDQMLVKPIEDGKTDVVVTVKWSCSESSGDKTASIKGSMGFEGAGSPFTPYASLTEAQVLEWIYARGLNKEQTEAVVAYDLAQLVSPPVVDKPLPWGA
jgi:hypothetical protein